MERKLEAAQESIGDHQQTILKFRDLVAKLQVRVHLNYEYYDYEYYRLIKYKTGLCFFSF